MWYQLEIIIGGYECLNSESNCENGGICKKSIGGYPYCDCLKGFEGSLCQFQTGGWLKSSYIMNGISRSLFLYFMNDEILIIKQW